MFSFKPLFDLLEEKNISRETMFKDLGLGGSTQSNLRNNMSVRLDTLDVICDYLNCDIGDIVEHVPNGSIPGNNIKQIHKKKASGK